MPKFKIEYVMECESRSFHGNEIIEANEFPKIGSKIGFGKCSYKPADYHCSMCIFGSEGDPTELEKIVISAEKIN